MIKSMIRCYNGNEDYFPNVGMLREILTNNTEQFWTNYTNEHEFSFRKTTPILNPTR